MTAKVCRGLGFYGAKLLYVGGVTNVSDGEEVDSQVVLGDDIDSYFENELLNNDAVIQPFTFVGASWGFILMINDLVGGNNIEIILEKPLFIKEFEFSLSQGWNRIGIFEPDFAPEIITINMPSSLDSLQPDNYFDLRYDAGPASFLEV